MKNIIPTNQHVCFFSLMKMEVKGKKIPSSNEFRLQKVEGHEKLKTRTAIVKEFEKLVFLIIIFFL